MSKKTIFSSVTMIDLKMVFKYRMILTSKPIMKLTEVF